MLALYVLGRISQIYAGHIPNLLIVILHVVPPALIAVVHGSALYRWKGIAVFAAFCLGIGTLMESVALRTGFPFGHYYFTDLMGPKIAQLPVLLSLAYLGIGYVSWILALLILRGTHGLAAPLLASFIMLAWDLAMDPVWSSIDRAWIWQDGGVWLGVPASNFAGWFLTAFLYYLGFTLYCRMNPVLLPSRPRFWLPVILTYAVCAAGNFLLLASPTATDTTGILRSCVLVSMLVMLPFAAMAWWRNRRHTDSGERQRYSLEARD